MLLPLMLALAAAAPGGEIVARVDSSPIPLSALERRIAITRANGGNTRPDDIVEDLVNEALLAAEAERLGLRRDPGVVAEIEAERRRLAGERFVAKEIEGGAVVEEALLREIFHAGADTVRLRLVMLASREQADAALARLRAGADFAAEAKNSLDQRSAASGGERQLQTRAEVEPALAPVAFSAPLNQLVGPVALDPGWAVLQVVERHLGDDAELARRRDELRRFAESQVRLRSRDHFVAQLRKAANVALDETFLRSLGSRLDATPAEAEHVLATVRGRALRYGDILPEIARLARGMTGGHFSGATVKIEIARSRIDRLLVEEEAMSRGYGKDPEVLRDLAGAERDALVRALAARLRRSAPSPTRAQIEAYYRQNQRRFQRPGRRECSHLVVANEGLAKRLRERIRAGEPFEKIAESFSLDESSAAKGGLLGAITDERLEVLSRPGGEPDFARAVQRSRPGEVSVPVKTAMGWHLVRCSAYAPPDPIPLAEVSEVISKGLAAESADAAVRDRVGALRARASISIDRKAVAHAGAQTK